MILAGLFGCKESSVKSIKEGEIHYSITFENRNAVLPDELMPDNLIVKFKDDKIIMEITSPVGNNGVFNIIDPDNNQIRTYLRILNMKYYYQGSSDEVPPGIDPLENMEIDITGEEKEILDLKCYQAIASLPDSDFSYELWFTNEIDLDKPNHSTPFNSIDGVLLNFFFVMGDIIIEFEAEGIYIRQIPDKAFEKSGSYRRIDRKSMDSIIARMMSL